MTSSSLRIGIERTYATDMREPTAVDHESQIDLVTVLLCTPLK